MVLFFVWPPPSTPPPFFFSSCFFPPLLFFIVFRCRVRLVGLFSFAPFFHSWRLESSVADEWGGSFQNAPPVKPPFFFIVFPFEKTTIFSLQEWTFPRPPFSQAHFSLFQKSFLLRPFTFSESRMFLLSKTFSPEPIFHSSKGLFSPKAPKGPCHCPFETPFPIFPILSNDR